jgi:hypothetical protein
VFYLKKIPAVNLPFTRFLTLHGPPGAGFFIPSRTAIGPSASEGPDYLTENEKNRPADGDNDDNSFYFVIHFLPLFERVPSYPVIFAPG